MTPRISIVLPTKNGAATLPALFDACARQRIDEPFEIVAIDSGSTDGTLDILNARADRVVRIAPGDFNHGTTRNVGIEHAGGELVVLLVQDAEPASADWLSALTAPFSDDPRLAGTFARQRPRREANALTRFYHERWAGASQQPAVVEIANREAFAALTPGERMRLCTFDNVCSCVRRSVWTAHPFKATAIAEDLEWARDVLLGGYRLAYVPSAAVIHSHERSPRYEFMRTAVLHHRLYDLFGVRTIPSAPSLVRACASSLVVHLRVEPGIRSAALAFAWPAGQYVGGLSAARGWRPVRSRMV